MRPKQFYYIETTNKIQEILSGPTHGNVAVMRRSSSIPQCISLRSDEDHNNKTQ